MAVRWQCCPAPRPTGRCGRVGGLPPLYRENRRLGGLHAAAAHHEGSLDDEVNSVVAAALASPTSAHQVTTTRVDVVVLSDELGRSFRKPHPAPFGQALRLLGADPGRSFFIGDHPDRDIAGAQHVGMRAIRVRTGEYASQPDVVTPWRTAPDTASALRALCEHACIPGSGN